MRLKASRGSEQYQAMNWSIAYSYTRREVGEAVKNSGFAVIQVRQAEYSATVIRLNPLLAHSDGLLMPQD